MALCLVEEISIRSWPFMMIVDVTNSRVDEI